MIKHREIKGAPNAAPELFIDPKDVAEALEIVSAAGSDSESFSSQLFGLFDGLQEENALG